MSKEYILDNLSCQELKELISKKKISLTDLDTAALEKLFNYELELICIDEGDTALMNACAKRLDELNGPLMSDEHFWNVINKAESTRVSELEKKDTIRPKKAFPAKRVLLLAAAIAVIAAIATITASAFGFDIFKYFKQIIDLPAGGNINEGVITLVNYGKTETFSSVDELLSTEELDILYPFMLPENITLEQVSISEGANGGDSIQFLTNEPSTTVTVDTNTEPFTVTGYVEQITTEKVTYYIFCDCGFYAICHHKNTYYYISSDSYENLILIIENMRENK